MRDPPARRVYGQGRPTLLREGLPVFIWGQVQLLLQVHLWEGVCTNIKGTFEIIILNILWVMQVLQAGDNNHFHPTCARCTKCGEPFGDGEEMFLQGAAIWHPRCGPSPENDVGGGGGGGGSVINGRASPFISPYAAPHEMDRQSTASEMPHGTPFHRHHGAYGSRASSPGASLR